MKLVVLCLLAILPAAQGQRFVCGAAQPDATELTQASRFTSTTAGFDLGTEARVADGSCSSSRPVFFSVAVPENNYRVTVVFGGGESSTTTVRAESRRLMLEQVSAGAKASVKRSFDVNVRYPEIAGEAGQLVKLKPRELDSPDWDHKLTLEFNGEHPSFRSITINPIKEPTVYLAGDSTVVDQTVEPWSAWGQMLPRFFRPGIVISNQAESGETIRSFMNEMRLAKVMSTIQPGDYLFFQFGHNDQKPNAVSLDDYKKLLAETIAQVREKGATPVLVTSMNRRTFDEHGKITNSLAGYPDAVRELAEAQHVALIDLNAMSKTLYEAMGVDGSLKAFMHYPANAYPNQPNPISDDTHFNGYGAYELARCVAKGIRDTKLPLRKFLVRDVGAFDPARPDPQATFNLPVTPVPVKTGDVTKVPQT
jgi:lysophospholipase L1-like esterase